MSAKQIEGTFSENCQSNAVPKELLTLISMIIDGTSVTSKLSQASLTCAQLIVSNYLIVLPLKKRGTITHRKGKHRLLCTTDSTCTEDSDPRAS